MGEQEIAKVLQVSAMKLHRVKQRFVESGLYIALNGHKGERTYKRKADGDFEAHLIALSCSDPPEGYAQWSLRLLADKAVELQYIENVSHETIRRVLNWKSPHTPLVHFIVGINSCTVSINHDTLSLSFIGNLPTVLFEPQPNNIM